MAFMDEFAAVLAEMEDGDLAPASFYWNNGTYSCFANGATKGGRLESYGWATEEDLIIIVRGELFAADERPVKGQTLVFAETTYRIDHVLTAPSAAFLRIACVSAARGA
jgi:hypothetical protein